MKSSGERNHTDLNHIYGHSFMMLCATHYESSQPDANWQFFNRGISGNRIVDLYARIKKDEIGEITIKENESRVELAPDVARHVMRSMQNGTINEFLVVCKAVSGAKEVNAKGEARGNGRKGGSRGGSKGGKPSSNRGKGRVVRR